ncbi:MAG: sulfite exporter TauE/SafE family protein [Desulfobacca sp.]|nr:sulfite exporter TauE/SafE family protein [Desulfobacca sp.]
MVGVAVGLGASFTGLGGGFLMVPLGIFWGLSVPEAVGTSFLAIVVISLSAVIAHRRLQHVNRRIGLLLGAGGLLGAQVGARLLPYVAAATFKKLFALILLLLALRMAFTQGKTPASPVTAPNSPTPGRGLWQALAMLLLGVLVGVAASFSGLGGGFLMVPLAIFLGLSVQEAVGTSFLAILIISLSALVAHGKLAHVNYPIGLAWGVGGILGAQIGARLLTYVSGPTFKKIFAALLVILAIRMFW